MPSSYSTNLKIELQATGENSGTWGTITNTNLGTALEQAIVGYGNPNYASDANLTLTYTDTNAAQAARALVLNVTSSVSLSTTRELVVPTIQKQYIVQNNTTGSQSITVKTSGGTGITVPNGRKAHLYVDGTNVIYMDDYVDINGGAIDGTPIGANSASTGAFSTLSATGNVNFDGGTFTFNDSGADRDFRVEGDTDANLLFSDASTDRIGIGTNTPASKLDVNGTITATAVNTTTLDLTNLEVTNIKAKDGTSAASIADSTGVVSFTANPTLSGGTANGVLYLNGSKVATSGSGLVFDGTNLTLGSSGKLLYSGVSYGVGIDPDGSGGFGAGYNFETNSGSPRHLLTGPVSGQYISSGSVPYIAWYAGSSAAAGTTAPELARLNSTGLGIGTSSPAGKVHAVASTAGTTSLFERSTASTAVPVFASRSLATSSGDMADGFGPTHAFAIQDGAAVINPISEIGAVREGADNSGGLVFRTYSAGTATTQMRLDKAGNLGLGVTPSAWGSSYRVLQLGSASLDSYIVGGANNFVTGYNFYRDSSDVFRYVNNAGSTRYSQSGGVHAWFNAPSGTAGNAITFTQAMTLDADGDLGVGITAPSCRLDLAGPSTAGLTNLVQLRTGSGNSFGFQIKGDHSTDGYLVQNYYNSYLAFGTNNTERARITSGGDFGIGTTSPSQRLDATVSSATEGVGLAVTNSNAGGYGSGISFYSFRGNGTTKQVAGSVEMSGASSWSSDATTSSNMLFKTVNANTLAERARIDSSGNLVLGSGGLDVSGTGGTSTAFNIRAGSGYAMVYGQTTATTTNSGAVQLVGATSGASAGGAAEILGVIQIAAESDSSTNATGYINFYTGSGGSATERARITSGGNLLIGGTSTTSAPTLNKGVYLQSSTNNDIIGYNLYVNDGANGRRGSFFLDDNAGVFGFDFSASSGVPDMVFRLGGTERARITSDGNFVIKSGAAVATNSLDSPFFYRIGGGGLSINANAESPGGPITFSTSNTERARITGDGELLIGTTSDSGAFKLQVAGDALITGGNALCLRGASSYVSSPATDVINFATASTERARITSGGAFLVGGTDENPSGNNVVGIALTASGNVGCTRNAGSAANFNRKTDDGVIVSLRQDGTEEGTISVSGNTVSYNAFAGSHWSQLQDGSNPDILRGTVMESINELCVWPDETNERLPKSKISDTVGSKKVYGVFMAWDNDWTKTNDMYVTAVGAFICRVNGSVTVQEGDLLESNGDGTARVQADDIIRSSTIGKVTSTVKTHEYDDGSYCVPTVLYCG